MTNDEKSALEPIRRVAMERLERMCLAARTLTPFVRVYVQSHDRAISWLVSAVASPSSDETVASVSVQLRADIAELDADILCSNEVICELSSTRFSLNDTPTISNIASTVGQFLDLSAPSFLECCQRVIDQNGEAP